MTATLDQHYTTEPAIADRLLAALRAGKGADIPITPETLAPLDQFHGRGLAATEEMVRLLAPQPGERVLDIGCGIGGPARWIAARFACHVTGIDLTESFCTAARALTEACGMADHVAIHCASATALPFPDGRFDRAYSQNVVMNIPDKLAMYREAFRVLKPGGTLVLSNILSGPAGPPHFPVPWASIPADSHLATAADTRRDLGAAGFEIIAFDTAAPSRRGNPAEARARISASGMQGLGLQVLMGSRFPEMMSNSLRSAEEGRIEAVEILLRKP